MKKSSQSKKLMRQMDKERRKKAKGIESGAEEPDPNTRQTDRTSDLSSKPPTQGGGGVTSSSGADADNNLHLARTEISGKNKIHTEIRTDDFVVRLLLSNSCRNTHDVSPRIP